MKRILAVFIVFIQLTGSAAQAYAEATFWSERRVLSPSATQPVFLPPLLSSRMQIKTDIPSANGIVRETYKQGAQKVILIQDIHLNREAQRNIAAILQNLINRKTVDLVGVEGAFEPFDFRPFRSFPDKDVNRSVADYFLNENKIGAPSYVGVTSSIEPPPFIGIDDPVHYEANVNAYLDSLDVKAETERRLRDIEKDLILKKRTVFSPLLQRFDQAIGDYESGRLDAAGFAQIGVRHGWRSDQIDAFVLACRLEKALDIKRVEQERKIVLERLSEKLDATEQARLVELARRYEEGDLRYAELYDHLETLLKRHTISLVRFPVFRDYLRYVAASDGIDGEKLLADIEQSKTATVDRLSATTEAKQLAHELARLRLTKKLIAFSLTPSEWETYKTLRNKTWAAPLKPFEMFYVHAEIRSQKMVNNVLSQKAKTIVLITGGFHSPHIKDLLKRRGISYTLVSPKMTTVEKEGGTLYLSVFTQEKSPVETLFAGEKLFVNPTAPQMGTSLGAENQTYSAVVGLVDEVVKTGAAAEKKGTGWTASAGTKPQRGKKIFAALVQAKGKSLDVYVSLHLTFTGWMMKIWKWAKDLFSPKKQGPFAVVHKRLRLELLESRRMTSANMSTTDDSAQPYIITPQVEEVLAPHVVTSVVQDQETMPTIAFVNPNGPRILRQPLSIDVDVLEAAFGDDDFEVHHPISTLEELPPSQIPPYPVDPDFDAQSNLAAILPQPFVARSMNGEDLVFRFEVPKGAVFNPETGMVEYATPNGKQYFRITVAVFKDLSGIAKPPETDEFALLDFTGRPDPNGDPQVAIFHSDILKADQFFSGDETFGTFYAHFPSLSALKDQGPIYAAIGLQTVEFSADGTEQVFSRWPNTQGFVANGLSNPGDLPLNELNALPMNPILDAEGNVDFSAYATALPANLPPHAVVTIHADIPTNTAEQQYFLKLTVELPDRYETTLLLMEKPILEGYTFALPPGALSLGVSVSKKGPNENPEKATFVAFFPVTATISLDAVVNTDFTETIPKGGGPGEIGPLSPINPIDGFIPPWKDVNRNGLFGAPILVDRFRLTHMPIKIGAGGSGRSLSDGKDHNPMDGSPRIAGEIMGHRGGAFQTLKGKDAKSLEFTLIPAELNPDVDLPVGSGDEYEVLHLSGEEELLALSFKRVLKEALAKGLEISIVVTFRDGTQKGFTAKYSGDKIFLHVPEGAVRMALIVKKGTVERKDSTVLVLEEGDLQVWDESVQKVPAVEVTQPDNSDMSQNSILFMVIGGLVVAAHTASHPTVGLKPNNKPISIEGLIALKPFFEVSKFAKLFLRPTNPIISDGEIHVPVGETPQELIAEIWSRFQTLHAVNNNVHMDVLLTEANDNDATMEALKIFDNLNGRIKIRRRDQYDTLEKLRGIVDNKERSGQIKFLIQRGAAVNQDFLKNIWLLSEEEGFADRIKVFILLNTTLRGDVGQLRMLKDLTDPAVYRLFRSQA